MILKFLLLPIFLRSVLALDCTQIPEAEIFAGNTVYLPGNYSTPQTIPANFNCVYRITVPVNSSVGLYALVTLNNGMKGANDQITVVEQTGEITIKNNRTVNGGYPTYYYVIPGAQMTIQVTTKSVFMNSQASITVSYFNADIGKTSPLKTGGDMNYYDLATVRDGKSMFTSWTFTSDQPIHMSPAIYRNEISLSDCFYCLVLDGTFENQTQIYKMWQFTSLPSLVLKSNAITVVSFEFFLKDERSGFVLNPISETEQFFGAVAMATEPHVYNGLAVSPGERVAVEVVNFDSTGITLTRLDIYSPTCDAYIVSGPPNNSSKVLLDLSTKPKLPYSFDLKYFTVIVNDCDIVFGFMSSHD